MDVVKLHGAWASSFSCRVIWALKLKGIPFDYIEEDLANKSPQLLKYNPVHKKIPVLVHDGRVVCESMVILEYLDEMWPEHPLFPSDPYERAQARFWIKFCEDKGPGLWMMYRTEGEEQEKHKRETLEMFNVLEEHCLKKGNKFFGGDNIDIVDIAFGWIPHWVGVVEEVMGVKLIEEENFPFLMAWMHNFKEAQFIKENLPDREKMVDLYRRWRPIVLASK